jgi:hypothetical protein
VPATCWPTSTAPGTSNGPTEAIKGRLEHLCGSALGFRNLTNYIARSLLETGGFLPGLHPDCESPFRPLHSSSSARSEGWSPLESVAIPTMAALCLVMPAHQLTSLVASRLVEQARRHGTSHRYHRRRARALRRLPYHALGSRPGVPTSR